jgi:hypothetical protein
VRPEQAFEVVRHRPILAREGDFRRTQRDQV